MRAGPRWRVMVLWLEERTPLGGRPSGARAYAWPPRAAALSLPCPVVGVGSRDRGAPLFVF